MAQQVNTKQKAKFCETLAGPDFQHNSWTKQPLMTSRPLAMGAEIREDLIKQQSESIGVGHPKGGL